MSLVSAVPVHPESDNLAAPPHLWTLVAIAVVAYSLADIVHEIVGHVGMCLLTGVKFTTISTIGITTTSSSRIVAAAGMITEVVAGVVSLSIVRRRRIFDATTWFLWLFGAVAAMNISYLLFSAITGGSDWGRVIAGLHPPILWRVAMGATGYAGYVLTLKVAARLIAGRVARSELWRLMLSASVTGGVVMTVASAFNPQGAKYILISGVPFLETIGLLRITVLARKASAASHYSEMRIERSPGWIIAGAVCAVVFVALIGPGIQVR